MKSTDEEQRAPPVPATATQGADARRTIAGVESLAWTERMLSALENGVNGGKWYALIDKVYASKTLAVAWAKVRANKGAAGVDGQSIRKFAAKADYYLAELSTALRNGSYRPQAVKRVEIPKGDGKTRPRPCGAWLRHDAFQRSRIASFSRRYGSSLNQSSRQASATGATASVVVLEARLRHDDAVAMMRCVRSTG